MTLVIILASALPALLLDPGAASLINRQTPKYSLDVFQTNIAHLENGACKVWGCYARQAGNKA